MTYKLIKRMIERQNYTTKEDMMDKIAVFNLRGILTDDEMIELLDMLEEK